MKKIYLFVFLIFVLPTVYFSCSAGDDEDDNDPPVIVYAKMNVNDTLWSDKAEKIILNDSTNINHEIDTIVLGKWMYINATFIDKGKGMSSFKIETNLRYAYNGSEAEGGSSHKYQDSILKIVKRGGVIYGQDTALVYRNWLLQIQDSITRNSGGETVRLKLVSDDYPLKVVCMDIDGNRDSVTFPVRYVRRADIYNARLE